MANPSILEPYFQIMDISPEQAERWLAEANLENRHMGDRSVDRIAVDIKAGNFKLTHQGIAFDTNNVLIDGQHRLQAIVRAKKSAKLFVCFGLHPDVRMFIDGGRQRSFSDVANYRNSGRVTPKVGSVTRTMMDPFRQFCFSRYQQVLYYEKHQDAVHSAIDMFKGAAPDVSGSAVLAAIARATYTQPLPVLSRFSEILIDPVNAVVRPMERAAAMLRDDLLRATQGDGRNRRVIYRRTEYLLDCFIQKNHKPSKKQIANTELFLVPGEPGFKKAVAKPAA